MAEEPQRGGAPSPGALPDFTAQDPRGPSGLPDYAAAGDGTVDEPSLRARNRALVVILTVIGSFLVLFAVVALILSQTVFRSALDPDDPDAYPTGSRTADGQSEYVPNEEDPDLAPPPPLFTQAPTSACTVPEMVDPPPADPGTVRGGDLEYTIPDGWDFDWGSGAMPYMTEVDAYGRNVEGSWYSVVNLGRVVYTEAEGGYPGLEPAAVDIFQCYATTSGVLGTFGENPEVTDYRTESTTVDGHPAWIVQATYNFEDPDALSTTSASVVTAIVVETPDGPSALASDVAADHEDHLAGLEEIIASLRVIA